MRTGLGRNLRKVCKFYSKIIMKNIGIFIFIGLLEVIFGSRGWWPNESIYAISLFVYGVLLPAFLAYGAAELLSEHSGGLMAVLAVTGIIVKDSDIGILGALLIGTLCGVVWKRCFMNQVQKVKAGLEMLCRNLAVAGMGIVFVLAAYFLLAPMLTFLMEILEKTMDFFIQRKLLLLLSVLIEPAKVLFLNNSINYGILIPLGMQQAEKAGSSILFLMESNPGPGLGVLLAMILVYSKKRREYGLGAFIHFVGGIHEMYFPVVYEHISLVISLIAGGMAGSICFSLFGVGLSAPAAPGSVLMILLLTERECMVGVIAGILLSTVVSFGLSVFFLQIYRQKKNQIEKQETRENKMIEVKEPIARVGFICDGGMGSSAMGASLLRRRLKKKGLEQVRVTAHAGDMVPKDLQLLVCQKSYLPSLEKEVGEGKNIYTVESLTDTKSLDELILQIEGSWT